MMGDTSENKTFKYKPRPGEKVKVYYKIRGRQPDYGIVVRVLNKYEREIVLLEKVNTVFELNELDYCIDAFKVDWTAKTKDNFVIKKRK